MGDIQYIYLYLHLSLYMDSNPDTEQAVIAKSHNVNKFKMVAAIAALNKRLNCSEISHCYALCELIKTRRI